MSSGLLVSRKIKEKLFCKKLKNPTKQNVDKFKEYNRIYTTLKRKSRNLYYHSIFKQYKNNIKKTWETINTAIGKKGKELNYPSLFILNGKEISGFLNIAENFNTFFAGIGPELASEIPTSTKNFKEYLKDTVETQFVFQNVTPELIIETMKQLKPKTSSGPDGISTKLLKEIYPCILEPLCYLLNLVIYPTT